MPLACAEERRYSLASSRVCGALVLFEAGHGTNRLKADSMRIGECPSRLVRSSFINQERFRQQLASIAWSHSPGPSDQR